MKQNLISVSGYLVDLDDVRGFFFEDGVQKVLIKTGWKLALTKEEFEQFNKAINTRVENIFLETRKSGLL